MLSGLNTSQFGGSIPPSTSEDRPYKVRANSI